MVDVSMISRGERITILATRIGLSFVQTANTFKMACDAASKFNNIVVELETAQQPPHHARKNRGFSGYKIYRN